jgi:CBS domain-containing protein
MMESTNNINLFIPIIFAVLIAYATGSVFTRSIYINSVRFKNIPFLIEHIPEGSKYVQAEDIMSKAVVALNFRSDMSDVVRVMKETPHNGFPVVNNFRKLMGIISRQYLHIMIKKKCFVSDYRKLDTSGAHHSGRHSLNSEY